MGQKRLDGAELHREPRGRQGAVVTVTADGIQWGIGQGLTQKLRVPVVVAEMDEHVRLGRPRRGQHGEIVAVGVGKYRRSNHGQALQ